VLFPVLKEGCAMDVYQQLAPSNISKSLEATKNVGSDFKGTFSVKVCLYFDGDMYRK
jgi:hypothetical protein